MLQLASVPPALMAAIAAPAVPAAALDTVPSAAASSIRVTPAPVRPRVVDQFPPIAFESRLRRPAILCTH